MARTCTVCGHPDRAAIDQALVAGTGTIRDIAARYRLASSSVQRHRERHLPEHLAKAQQAHEVAQADNLLSELDRLREDAKRIGGKAERAEGYQAAIAAIREQSRLIELLLKVAELALQERAQQGEQVVKLVWQDGSEFVRFAAQPDERG